jgi:hypothetical protein
MISLLLFYSLLISITGYAVFFWSQLKWKFESSLLFTVSSLICVLYFSGFIGIVEYMSYAIYFIGFILLFIGLLLKYKQDNSIVIFQNTTIELLPRVFILYVLASMVWVYYRQFTFSLNDEFSHWGLVYKEFLYWNGFPQGFSRGLFLPSYPPALVIFQYFVAKIIGEKERSAFIAQNLFILISLYGICGFFPKKKYWLSLGIITFGWFFSRMLGFSNPVENITADAPLGILFGAAIVSYLLSEDRQNGALIRVIPILIIITLIKPTGVGFALVIAAVVLIDQVLVRIIQPKFSIKNWKSFLDFKWFYILEILLIVTSPYIAYRSWNKFLEAQNLIGAQPLPSVNIIYRSFISGNDDRSKDTISNFANALDNSNYDFVDISVKEYFLIIFSASIAISFLHKSSSRKNEVFLINVFLLVGAFCYGFLLLVVFLFIFSSYEGIQLAGFNRYMGSYILGWGIINFGLIAEVVSLQENDFWSRRLASIGVVVILFIVVWYTPVNSYLKIAPGLSRSRREAKFIHQAIEKYIQPQDRIFNIYQGEENTITTHFQIHYEFVPNEWNFWFWSLGSPYFEGDVWTADISPSDWMKMLEGGNYDYVLVSYADEKFWSRYGELFDQYRIDCYPQLFMVGGDSLNQVNKGCIKHRSK